MGRAVGLLLSVFFLIKSAQPLILKLVLPRAVKGGTRPILQHGYSRAVLRKGHVYHPVFML